MPIPPTEKHHRQRDALRNLTPEGGSGEPPANLEISGDISARHRSEILFRGLLESAPDAIVIAGQDGRILLVNAQTEKLFGYSREELLGRPVEMLVPARFHTVHQKHRETYTTSPHSRPMDAGLELFALRKDGSELPVEISLSPLKTEDEFFVFSSIRDATERRLAQQALAQANHELERRVAERTAELRHNDSRLRALVESIDEIVFELDAQGTCLGVWTLNDVLLPHSKEKMIGVNISGLLDEDGRNAFSQALQRVAASGTAADFEYSQPLSSGKKSFLSRITPIRLPDSETFCMLVRDITEQKILQQRMAQGQKMEAIGRLAGGIAHDFNNLLAIVLGYAELIQEAVEQGKPVQKEPAEIIRATESAASLTRQLLAFSRQQVLEPRPVSLNSVVREIEGLVKQLVGESITVTLRTDPQLQWTKADPSQMQQVILNLAANARDAMADGGDLEIHTANLELNEPYAGHPEAQPGKYVVLTVSDNGAGMDAETQARIFEPFFTTKTQGKGTGLGLATVYGIVRQSGGHIWLFSEVGRGTTFMILLPQLAGEPKPIEAEDLQESSAAPAGGETILLVEDADPLRRLVGETLAARGYKVLEAGNGIGALRLIADYREPIHLLITDMAMPEMGGRKLSEQVTAMRPGIRVLFITGHGSQAWEGGRDVLPGASLLEKPFTRTALVRKVYETLHRSQKGESAESNRP